MTFAEEFCDAWDAKVLMDELLFRLVEQTASRAAGCWRLDRQILHLAWFGYARDMPHDVSQGFQDATRSVPLNQLGLGIVKAAVTEQPAIGRRDAGMTGLGGSASWIVRFDANTSLAVPIRNEAVDRVVGVLAVSTADWIEPDDSLWRTLTQLSREIGRARLP